MRLILALVFACYLAAPAAAWPTYSATTFLSGTSLLTATSQTNDPSVYATLNLTVRAIGDNVMRINLKPVQLQQGQQDAYVIPEEVFPRPVGVVPEEPTNRIHVTVGANGNITVTQPDGPSKKLFTISDIQFGPNYLAFNSAIDTTTTFLSGYGEHEYYYFINNDVRENNSATVELSLWNTDNGTPWQNPMYGVHPVIFVADPANAWFYAVVVVNSHAQRLNITAAGLGWYFIGGELDAYVITGTTMAEVIARYHTQVIRPSYVPPYWSLGTHQCRWGYKNLSDVKAVVAGYAAANLPLEVMWNDIDYMDRFRIFTTDPVNYPPTELKAFVDELHSNGQHYVQIVDPGVAQADYPVFWSGLNESVYVNRSAAMGGGPLVNVVWPGWTVFPDFTNDRVGDWWQGQLKQYFQTIDLDGVWLDMNELGVFCQGQCDAPIGTPWTWEWLNCNWTELTVKVCGTEGHCGSQPGTLNNPNPMPLTNGWQLSQHTIDMTGELSMGLYYDTKAFYGLMEERQSNRALSGIRPHKRPFLLSRASFVGSGQYTSHWTGDNNCLWGPREGGLADSIQSVLGANLWGISHIGADIGGFGGTPEQQLLTRWTQLGAFYSFMRNHHGLDDSPGQEPYRWAPEAVDAMRRAMHMRYRLLPYLFTALVDSHYKGGAVLMHPSVAFPTDEATYKEMFSFMFGSSIYVLPVIQPNVSHATGYLPSGTWFNLWALSGSLNGNAADPIALGPQPVWTPSSPLYTGDIPAYVAAGSAIPYHATIANTVVGTTLGGVSLLLALTPTGNAAGYAAFDNGAEGPVPDDYSAMFYVDYTCQVSAKIAVITSQSRSTTANYAPPSIQAGYTAFVVLWFPSVVPTAFLTQATLNGKSLPASSWSTDVALGFTRVNVSLPAGVDATTDFVLVLGSDSNSGAQTSTSNDEGVTIESSWYYLCACFVLGFLMVVAVMAYRRNRQERAAARLEANEMLACQS